MAANTSPSVKRTLITKANSTVVITTSVACFIVVFSLVASHTLFSQMMYQNRIISAKKQALSQLKSDLSATTSLSSSYQAFVGTSQNVLGGSSGGTGDKDGDNAKIVLDALPSKYDFPALATSLEKILTGQNVQIQSISGTDDEVAQSGKQTSAAPAPVAIPFQVTVSGNYQSIQNVVKAFDASIRPIQVQSLTVSGDQSNLALSVTAQTFYQPEKSLNVTTKVVQ